jgi:hypothetical protein
MFEHGPFYPDGGALYLTGVKYHDDGTVKSGWVVNGWWSYELRNGEALAKDKNRIVTRRPYPGYTIVPAPQGADAHDYNDVIAQARKLLNETH